jgi:hypothetical protein
MTRCTELARPGPAFPTATTTRAGEPEESEARDDRSGSDPTTSERLVVRIPAGHRTPERDAPKPVCRQRSASLSGAWT